MKYQAKSSLSSKIFYWILLLSCCMLFPWEALAQSEGWSNPKNISNSPGNSSNPSLSTDTTGNVHLVWIEEDEVDETAVMYTVLGEDGWGEPVDIFATGTDDPIGNAQILGNSLGYLHTILFWQGIRYSRAYAPEAGSAQNWLKPELLVVPVNNRATRSQ